MTKQSNTALRPDAPAPSDTTRSGTGSPADAQKPPGPTGGLPFFGEMFQVRRDPLHYFGNAFKTHGDVVRLVFAKQEYLLLNSPEAIKHVLHDKARNYGRGPSARALTFMLGKGLITNDGESWLRQRRLAQPAFHRDRLRELVRRMAEATEDMLTGWAARPARAAIDVNEEMYRVTLDVVGRTLFGQRLEHDSEIGEVTSAIVWLAKYANSPLALPWWVPTPANLRFKRAREASDKIVYRLIAERRAANARAVADEARPQDLLGMLMDARDDETNESMTDLQLRDELVTMVMAGHETTANTLTWTLYLLSRHPDVARKVDAEVEQVLGGRTPAFEDLGKLRYLQAVMQEALRLYPPIWGLERQTVEDDVIAGYTVAGGTVVLIVPFLVHRNPTLWPNPEVFDPERFLSGAEPSRFAYLPFSAGPRICIGKEFAIMEEKIILSMISQRFRLELEPDTRIEYDQALSLRPRNGMPMTLISRSHPSP